MALLRRTLDAAFLNSVCADPEVRPWLGGEGDLDLSELIANPANFALVGEHGGFMLIGYGGGVYEVHTQVLPSGRGGWALQACEEGLRYMFAETDATELLTKVPEGNKPAMILTRQMGFQERFRRAGAWSAPDGSTDTVIYFALTLDRWRGRDKAVQTMGEAFHAQLEAAKLTWGSDTPVHADDEAHDRAAGAAVMMMRAGQPVKAVTTYNKWAIFAGYQTIELLSLAPLVVDIRDARVTARDGEMEVLSMPQSGKAA